MKVGELITMTALVFNVEYDIAFRVARYLREAGLMTTGARGVNAPDMTTLDAARMLIAFMGDQNPGKAAERIVRKYGTLAGANLDKGQPLAFSIEALCGEAPQTFEAGVADLISIYAHKQDTEAFKAASTEYRDATTIPECSVELIMTTQPQAVIHMRKRHEQGERYDFSGDFMTADEARDRRENEAPPVIRKTELDQDVIEFIAQGFR